MDYDSLLNLEKRTGVKDVEIDEFNRKADAVQAAIKGMLDGTLDPSKIKIDGIDSLEEIEAKEAARVKRIADIKIRDEEKRVKRKQEERDLWWRGAEFYMEGRREYASNNSAEPTVALAQTLNYHQLNYAKWDTWEPTDEVSVREKAEAERIADEARDREFEANNKEFCDGVIENKKQRDKDAAKKVESADLSRKRGNEHFKHKRFDQALECYITALKTCPHDVNILSNIAQVHIKQDRSDDALEFLSRVLFIDNKHIKALFRKAEIHNKRSEFPLAIDLLTVASAVDVGNAEVNALLKDIRLVQKELDEEEKLRGAVGGVSVSEDMKSGVKTTSTTTTTATPTLNTTNDLSSDITSLHTLLDPLKSMTVDHMAPLLNEEFRKLATSLMARITLTAADKPLTKTQIRTTDTLAHTFQYLRGLLVNVNVGVSTTAGDVVTNENSAQITHLIRCLQFITCCVGGQRSSQQLLLDSKLIPSLKDLFTRCRRDGSDSETVTIGKLELTTAVLVLFETCVEEEEVCPRLRTALLTDRDLFSRLSAVLENVSQAGLPVNINGHRVFLSTVLSAANIVKECAFSTEHGKTVFTAMVGHVVCSLGSALSALLAAKATTRSSVMWRSVCLPVAERLVETAVGLSQIESMRSFFVVELETPSENTTNNTTTTTTSGNNKTQTTAGVIIAVLNANPELGSNCLAALMNVCTGTADTVKLSVAVDGGLQLLVNNLLLSDDKRVALDANILVRKAGLLSRLTSLLTVQSALKTAANYRALCHRLVLNPAESDDKCRLDERAHYVRVLASLNGVDESSRVIAREECVVQSLLAIFPVPRDDLGVVTAQSVTLIPREPQTAMLLGNAAKCLINCVEDKQSAEILYTSSELQGIEKLICALATCTDAAVRKNISILLAKGCQLGEKVRARVTDLRGLEIMRKLNAGM